MLGQTLIGGGPSIHKIANSLTLHVWSSSNDGAEMNKFSKKSCCLTQRQWQIYIGLDL